MTKSEISQYMAKIGAKGGRTMTEKKRKALAKLAKQSSKAARARWDKEKGRV